MFDSLIKRVQIKLHNGGFELARCNDVYRLAKVLGDMTADFAKLRDEAEQMVKEVESAYP